MKNYLLPFMIITILAMLNFCKPGTDTKKTNSSEGAELSGPEAAAEESPAVCVYWGDLGLRSEPVKDGKWLTSVRTGEKVTSLGLTSVDSANNTEYVKIRLLDGTEGWTLSYLIIANAQPAVIVTDAEIYSRPDLLTRTNKNFSKMDIVAVTVSEGEWIEIKGKRAEGRSVESGWIKPINISYEAADIAVSLYTRMALAEKATKDKIASLQEIIQNQDLSNSELIPEVIEILDELKKSVESK
jgi:uncharacterized protein YgiM (DUF1202 family)